MLALGLESNCTALLLIETPPTRRQGEESCVSSLLPIQVWTTTARHSILQSRGQISASRQEGVGHRGSFDDMGREDQRLQGAERFCFFEVASFFQSVVINTAVGCRVDYKSAIGSVGSKF